MRMIQRAQILVQTQTAQHRQTQTVQGRSDDDKEEMKKSKKKKSKKKKRKSKKKKRKKKRRESSEDDETSSSDDSPSDSSSSSSSEEESRKRKKRKRKKKNMKVVVHSPKGSAGAGGVGTPHSAKKKKRKKLNGPQKSLALANKIWEEIQELEVATSMKKAIAQEAALQAQIYAVAKGYGKFEITYDDILWMAKGDGTTPGGPTPGGPDDLLKPSSGAANKTDDSISQKNEKPIPSQKKVHTTIVPKMPSVIAPDSSESESSDADSESSEDEGLIPSLVGTK